MQLLRYRNTISLYKTTKKNFKKNFFINNKVKSLQIIDIHFSYRFTVYIATCSSIKTIILLMLLKLILNLNFWRRKRWNKENFLRAYNVKTKEKNRSTFGKFNVCYTKFKVFLKVFFSLHIIHTTPIYPSSYILSHIRKWYTLLTPKNKYYENLNFEDFPFHNFKYLQHFS